MASEGTLERVFETKDVLEISKIILNDGEIQFTSEYRAKLKEAKTRQIITMIARYGIDPKTKLPHPPNRIEKAMEEAKASVDLFKSAKTQTQEIIKKILPVLPIKLVSKLVNVVVPAEFSGKAYPVFRQFGKPKQENWLNDGSLSIDIEIPAGVVNELFDQLNSMTKGQIETKILKEE